MMVVQAGSSRHPPTVEGPCAPRSGAWLHSPKHLFKRQAYFRAFYDKLSLDLFESALAESETFFAVGPPAGVRR